MFTSASRLASVVRSLAPNLKCLLHMDGGDGSTSWTDTLGHAVAASGSVVQKTAASKFGASGTQFSGVNDMLTVSSTGDLAFGTGDFGVSCWVNRTATGASYQAVASTRIISDQDNRIYWEIGLQSNGGIYFYSGGFQLAVNTNLVPVGAWTHIEVNRASGVTTFYVNGVSAGAFSDTGNYTSGTITLGSFNAGAADLLTAYMDEFAVSVGAPLHTGNFSPPSGPYNNPAVDPYFSSVALLLHLDGADAGTVFTDVKGATITRSGNAQTTRSNSKFGGSSLALDGSSYIVTPVNALYGMGTGDFTIEFWFYASNTGGSGPAMFDMRQSGLGSSQVKPTVFWNSGQVLFYVNGATRISSGALSTGQWYAVAISRNSGTTRMFINGTLVGSPYADTNDYGASNDIIIGEVGDSRGFAGGFFVGDIDEIRLTKSVGRYTASYGIATSAFPDR